MSIVSTDANIPYVHFQHLAHLPVIKSVDSNNKLLPLSVSMSK